MRRNTLSDLKYLIFDLPEEIKKLESGEDYLAAKDLIEWWLRKDIPEYMRKRLQIELLRIERLPFTYPFTFEDALKEAKQKIRDFTDEEFLSYFKRGFIDFIRYDSKILVERRFIDNLGFMFPEIKGRIIESPDSVKAREFLEERVRELIAGDKPKKWYVRARITYWFKDPVGRKVRLWLPMPRNSIAQSSAQILGVSHEDAIISDNQILQRTVSFSGYDTEEFWVEFCYHISEQFSPELFNSFCEKKFKSNGDTEKIEEFLEEKAPHLVFTPSLKIIAKNITKSDDKFIERIKNVYDFVTLKVRYSYVKPYIFYDNIPQFVAENLRGDCGFQALLFIALCRILGIPARWQSGWFITPFGASPHDWAVAYFGKYGWRPVDLSFGGKKKDDLSRRVFYLGNLDGCRMIANDEFMCDFYPETNFIREDPYDNQVGEAEYEDGKAYGEHKIEVLEFREA
ncbi:MAG: transglutaminase-like domain-containing protein [candidate division WOR-3 bacterium]